jgi:cytochrome oxidase assembly protein ShyY1
MMSSSKSRWALSFIALLIVVYTCARLGWWQWERAAAFKAAEQPVADQPRVALNDVTSPLVNLDAESEGRLIFVEGRYSRQWIVPARQSGSRTGPWNVALLERSDGTGILVVRGWDSGDQSLTDVDVRVEGRLLPSQNPELSASVDGEELLARVDPALVIGKTSADLYDGYVIASSEVPSVSVIERVPAPEVRKSPPGYYLQHLAYVILWWFFGLVAIIVWSRALFQDRSSRRTVASH